MSHNNLLSKVMENIIRENFEAMHQPSALFFSNNVPQNRCITFMWDITNMTLPYWNYCHFYSCYCHCSEEFWRATLRYVSFGWTCVFSCFWSQDLWKILSNLQCPKLISFLNWALLRRIVNFVKPAEILKTLSGNSLSDQIYFAHISALKDICVGFEF